MLFASAGHAADDPVQDSATSHTPAAPRHCVVAGAKTSVGQSFAVPSQNSATSQAPAEARHCAVLFASVGQLADDPLQLSAG